MCKYFSGKLKIIYLALLALSFILAGCGGKSDQPDQSLLLDDLSVYGESAILKANGEKISNFNLLCQDENGRSISVLCGDTADSGLLLWRLLPGTYTFQINGRDLLAEEDFLPLSGYTLPRDGCRSSWLFQRDASGRLLLTIREALEMPSGYYDIFIDIGHGGQDKGAVMGKYIEANENLLSGQFLAEMFRGAGLRVCLSRLGPEISGGQAAEDNPYLPGARIDRAYRSHACYLISNHLNAAAEAQHGWQIYCSVKASTKWAEQIGRLWQDMGWPANNSNKGLVADGIYQRWQEDEPQTGRDYYFILRETGGNAIDPHTFSQIQGSAAPDLRKGPQAILLEYAFLDSSSDMAYWRSNYPELIAAAYRGSMIYWQIFDPDTQNSSR